VAPPVRALRVGRTSADCVPPDMRSQTKGRFDTAGKVLREAQITAERIPRAYASWRCSYRSSAETCLMAGIVSGSELGVSSGENVLLMTQQ